MKKSVFAFILAVVTTTSAFSQFEYSTNSDNTLTITLYYGGAGPVVIPESINDMTVTTIGDGAFDSAYLSSISMPNTIISIGANAFFACQSLTNAPLPDGLVTIGDFAFSDCFYLSNFFIPTSVKSIGSDAFQWNRMAQAIIPDNVTNLGQAAFGECPLLTNVVIGSGVTSINDWEFWDCTNLTSITIPTNIDSIGMVAFYECFALPSISIPASITNIGFEAFDLCNNLQAINVDSNNPVFSSLDGVLFDKAQSKLLVYPDGLGGAYRVPDGVISLADEAFQDAALLTSATIPNSVTNLGQATFFNCVSLQTVTLPQVLAEIGSQDFDNCISLTNAVIPASVTVVGPWAFLSCNALSNIFFSGDAPVIDYAAFVSDNVTAYYLPRTLGWTDFSTNGVQTSLWSAAIQTGDSNFGWQNDQFGFDVAAGTNIPAAVQFCTNLSAANWETLTNLVVNGSYYFTDPSSTKSAARFYRVGFP